jgi:predicted transcriptional regulator
MVVDLCLTGKDAKELASEMNLERSVVQRCVREYHTYADNSFK